LDKRGTEARFSVAAIAQKGDRPTVDGDRSRVQWFESLLDESKGKSLSEQVRVKGLARVLAKRPAEDGASISRDEEFEALSPP
jgi:hypothetical protein